MTDNDFDFDFDVNRGESSSGTRRSEPSGDAPANGDGASNGGARESRAERRNGRSSRAERDPFDALSDSDEPAAEADDDPSSIGDAVRGLGRRIRPQRGSGTNGNGNGNGRASDP